MSRLCERPGCAEVAVIAYGFDADRLLVWLAPRPPDSDRMLAGALCRRHAEALVVPRGWTLDDRREIEPRLFAPAEPTANGKRKRASPRLPREPAADQLVLPDGTDAGPAAPWDARFDVLDDLGGVLAADSPLLSRAFRGTFRRR